MCLDFRTRLMWGCAVGFLHKNLQQWNQGSLADNEVAEDLENGVWNTGTICICLVVSFIA